MKKLNDNQIQQLLDEGLKAIHETGITSSEMKEVETYDTLFNLLDKGPEGGLPYGFPTKVTRQVTELNNRRIALKWYVLAFGIGCIGIVFSYALLSAYDTGLGSHFYAIIFTYKWAFVLLLFLILSTHYLEKRLRPNSYV